MKLWEYGISYFKKKVISSHQLYQTNIFWLVGTFWVCFVLTENSFLPHFLSEMSDPTHTPRNAKQWCERLNCSEWLERKAQISAALIEMLQK